MIPHPVTHMLGGDSTMSSMQFLLLQLIIHDTNVTHVVTAVDVTMHSMQTSTGLLCMECHNKSADIALKILRNLIVASYLWLDDFRYIICPSYLCVCRLSLLMVLVMQVPCRLSPGRGREVSSEHF